jgi:hypothetical protein
VEAATEASRVGMPEQVSDRALERAEEDLLGHSDFVARLVALITSAPTPTNIALFGRWGSGKTGVAKRLEEVVRADLDGFRWAYFDAFKFARLPLLRRFLVRLAFELGGKESAKRYRRRLYERRERVRFVNRRARANLMRWVLIGAVAISGLVFVLGVAVVALPSEPAERVAELFQIFLPALIPTGVIAAALAFAIRNLSVTTTREAPDSDEQFEALFKKLLRRSAIGIAAGEEKLVCFIDELDRCSPEEVVRTLEGLKTFLDEPGCIFIVAADQQVLERALSREARQATPRDLTNPYYSSGSAYLDKIFQAQVSLPPLFPERLTDFALTLLAGVGGVWSEVPEKADVVSVLLPVSVHSPRRVKVLLNAFAQTYALALAREERLGGGIGERSVEIAKLVCLQVEFPLFAADLARISELCSLVVSCADALDEGSGRDELVERPGLEGIAPETLERASAYALGELPTDATLDDPGSRSQGSEEAGTAMRRAQRTDLLDYLRQTNRIAGPRNDLIYLEGRGVVHGLDAVLATQIEEMALKSLSQRLTERLEPLDSDQRRAALGVLKDLVRRSKGNDRDNAVSSLLAALPQLDDHLVGVTPWLLSALADQEQRGTLKPEEAPGALDLAIKGKDLELERALLGSPAALETPLRTRALERAGDLLMTQPSRLGELMLAEIVADPDAAAERLGDGA